MKLTIVRSWFVVFITAFVLVVADNAASAQTVLKGGDSFDTATELQVGKNVCGDCYGYFKFILPKGKKLDFRHTASSNFYSIVLKDAFFNSKKEPLFQSDFRAQGINEFSEFSYTKGVNGTELTDELMYLNVSGWSGTGPSFDASIDLSFIDYKDANFQYDVSDEFTAAQGLPEGEFTTTLFGYGVGGDYADMYKINVSDNTILKIDSINSEDLGFAVALYKPDPSFDFVDLQQTRVLGEDFTGTFNIEKGGVYFLKFFTENSQGVATITVTSAKLKKDSKGTVVSPEDSDFKPIAGSLGISGSDGDSLVFASILLLLIIAFGVFIIRKNSSRSNKDALGESIMPQNGTEKPQVVFSYGKK